MFVQEHSKPPIDDAFALLELFFLRGADKYCAEFFSSNWEKIYDKFQRLSASERRLILASLMLCEPHIFYERISLSIERDGTVDSFVKEVETLPMLLQSLDPPPSQGTYASLGSDPEVPKTTKLFSFESPQGVARSGSTSQAGDATEIQVDGNGEGLPREATGGGSVVKRLGIATGIQLALGVAIDSLYSWDTFNPTNNNHTQSLSSKILAYGIAGCSVIGALFAFVGLSIWTMQPRRLPFGCNPEEAMLNLFSVANLGLANAYIAIMRHRHLRDSPFLMWTVIVLLCAIITTVLSSIRK